jgi:chemotaxis protein histidine kinase CheA
VAHTGESVLSKLRDGALSLNAEITSGLLAMVDAVRRMLNEIQATESDGDNDYAELLERLKSLQSPQSDTVPPPEKEKASPLQVVPPSPDAQQASSLRILEVPTEPVTPSKSQPETITAPEPGPTEKFAAPQFLPSAAKISGLPLARKSFKRRPMNLKGMAARLHILVEQCKIEGGSATKATSGKANRGKQHGCAHLGKSRSAAFDRSPN